MLTRLHHTFVYSFIITIYFHGWLWGFEPLSDRFTAYHANQLQHSHQRHRKDSNLKPSVLETAALPVELNGCLYSRLDSNQRPLASNASILPIGILLCCEGETRTHVIWLMRPGWNHLQSTSQFVLCFPLF